MLQWFSPWHHHMPTLIERCSGLSTLFCSLIKVDEINFKTKAQTKGQKIAHPTATLSCRRNWARVPGTTWSTMFLGGSLNSGQCCGCGVAPLPLPFLSPGLSLGVGVCTMIPLFMKFLITGVAWTRFLDMIMCALYWVEHCPASLLSEIKRGKRSTMSSGIIMYEVLEDQNNVWL